jgi:hypothetical protein
LLLLSRQGSPKDAFVAGWWGKGQPAAENARYGRPGRLPPEVLKSIRRQLGVSHCVLDIPVTEIGLQRPRIVALVGQSEAAGVPARTNENKRRAAMKSFCRTVAAALPACQMIFDVIGDLLADRRQPMQLVLDDRIVGLRGKFPKKGRLAP